MKSKHPIALATRRLIMEYDAAMHEAIGALLKGGNVMVVGAGSRLDRARQALIDAIETAPAPAVVAEVAPPDSSGLATVEQLRLALGGVSVATIRAWCRDPEFPVIKVGRLSRFEIPAVREWVRDGGPQRASQRRKQAVEESRVRRAVVGQ